MHHLGLNEGSESRMGKSDALMAACSSNSLRVSLVSAALPGLSSAGRGGQPFGLEQSLLLTARLTGLFSADSRIQIYNLIAEARWFQAI